MNAGSGCAAAHFRRRYQGAGLFPPRNERQAASCSTLARGRRRACCPDVAGHRPGGRADLEPRPQRPCRRPVAVAGTRQSAGLCHRDRRARPAEANAARPLPIGGTTDVLGIAITTGRNGHAPGGVWLHFGVDGGFLYTGDYSTESMLYAYDPPGKAAATVLIDCSYADYQKPLAECWDEPCPICRARPAVTAGAGQRARSGDRARTDAPRRRRIFSSTTRCERRCNSWATAMPASLRARCRRRHQAPRRNRQTDRRRARRHARRIRRRHVRRDRATHSAIRDIYPR